MLCNLVLLLPILYYRCGNYLLGRGRCPQRAFFLYFIACLAHHRSQGVLPHFPLLGVFSVNWFTPLLWHENERHNKWTRATSQISLDHLVLAKKEKNPLGFATCKPWTNPKQKITWEIAQKEEWHYILWSLCSIIRWIRHIHIMQRWELIWTWRQQYLFTTLNVLHLHLLSHVSMIFDKIFKIIVMCRRHRNVCESDFLNY